MHPVIGYVRPSSCLSHLIPAGHYKNKHWLNGWKCFTNAISFSDLILLNDAWTGYDTYDNCVNVAQTGRLFIIDAIQLTAVQYLCFTFHIFHIIPFAYHIRHRKLSHAQQNILIIYILKFAIREFFFLWIFYIHLPNEMSCWFYSKCFR